jgi:2-C-methyl-D-erythritol 4-phosphate cytidylyltransferase/2-C-methyl-D-erythritol 2,4-cyclodiphosphate synthase
VQTPQAFKFSLILDLHRKNKTAVTDDIALCETAGCKIAMTQGDRCNFKITHVDDFALMEQNLGSRCGDVRTGTGYDVHRLVAPAGSRKLMIGGIEIAHDKVLEGHSDADVALHAITDALLGAICDGDIGMHFSPKDARWKGADSATFLRHAGGLTAKQGGIISHVDVTIICEAPKIGPHRDKIRTRIGEILNLPVNRVSVKATTTEGLGFTGRGEGIAAEAVATVRLPFAPPKTPAEETIRKWGT